MSATETTMTADANRALIDARLDAIDRALLGRISRAERLDVAGEVESRIDELLRERCGAGAEPSREDVLAVLVRLDPPEAYLGDEAVPREAGERPTAHARVAPSTAPTPAARTANAPAILGLFSASGSIMFPVGWLFVLNGGDAGSILLPLWGLSALGMMFGGGLAVTLGLVERPRRPMTLAGLIAGAAAFGFGLAEASATVLFLLG